MNIEIDNKKYNVIIKRKISNKNTYLRIKEDLNIYITTNTFTSDKFIESLIYKNIDYLRKNIDKIQRKNNKKNDFYYLGKKINIIYSNINIPIINDNTITISKEYFDKWINEEAVKVFREELDKIYNNFPFKIPYPSLTIRNMKTRWGVCNTRTKRITLNKKLINMNIKYLDYVIVHELCHLLYANHGKEFWNLVKEIIPNYKELRKEMKDE